MCAMLCLTLISLCPNPEMDEIYSEELPENMVVPLSSSGPLSVFKPSALSLYEVTSRTLTLSELGPLYASITLNKLEPYSAPVPLSELVPPSASVHYKQELPKSVVESPSTLQPGNLPQYVKEFLSTLSEEDGLVEAVASGKDEPVPTDKHEEGRPEQDDVDNEDGLVVAEVYNEVGLVVADVCSEEDPVPPDEPKIDLPVLDDEQEEDDPVPPDKQEEGHPVSDEVQEVDGLVVAVLRGEDEAVPPNEREEDCPAKADDNNEDDGKQANNKVAPGPDDARDEGDPGETDAYDKEPLSASKPKNLSHYESEFKDDPLYKKRIKNGCPRDWSNKKPPLTWAKYMKKEMMARRTFRSGATGVSGVFKHFCRECQQNRSCMDDDLTLCRGKNVGVRHACQCLSWEKCTVWPDACIHAKSQRTSANPQLMIHYTINCRPIKRSRSELCPILVILILFMYIVTYSNSFSNSYVSFQNSRNVKLMILPVTQATLSNLFGMLSTISS